MSHFYAAIPTSARRTIPTACGHKSTGVTAYAASWRGRISVRLYVNDEGEDMFSVYMEPHNGKGDSERLAVGMVGDAASTIYPATA